MTNKDHIERTKRMIEVMQAYIDGEAVEYFDGLLWKVAKEPTFASHIDWRIAKTPDQINWDHVAPEFKYMARDEDGQSYLYNIKPCIELSIWCVTGARVTKPENYASYKRGTVDWKDSLVIRTGAE